jgi:hypothetical protein
MQEVNETSAAEHHTEPEIKKRKKKRDPLEVVDTRVRAIHLVLGALAIVCTFAYLQFRGTDSVCCGDFDGYYHIRWSQLLWEGIRHGHFPPAFTWLPLTTLNPKDYVDHHLLFHIFQIPFTWSGDLRLGAKISATLFASLAVFSCYALIIRYRIRYALVWLIALLACSAPFLYRLSMAKAPPFAIIYMAIGIYLLFEKKYWALLPLTFLFALTYDLFLLLPIAVVIWIAIMLWSGEKFAWRPILWVALGSIAGFVINPYFPKNVMLYVEHAVMKLNPTGFKTNVGQEWYPYESWYFLGSCFVAFAAMITGYIAFNGSDRKRAAKPLFFLIFSTLLLVVNANWRRFVEYWPPFAVLFAAFALEPVLTGTRGLVGKLPDHFMVDLMPFLDREDRPENIKEHKGRLWIETELALVGALLAVLPFILYTIVPSIRTVDQTTHVAHVNRMQLWIAIAASVLFVGGLVGYFVGRGIAKGLGVVAVTIMSLILFVNVVETRKSIAESAKPDYYKGGMDWIRTNVPPGQIVFNTDWDDFPKLFFYDTTHAYVSGLDPTYLLDKNPDLSKLYEDITLGHEKDPAPLIRDRFGANYIFTDNEKVHDDFFNNAHDSGWVDVVYEDNDCTVLKIRDAKGEPPSDDEKATDEDEGDDNSANDEGQ